MMNTLKRPENTHGPGFLRQPVVLLKQLWSLRLARFLAIGFVNTLFSYTIYSILVLIGLHYSLATLIATVLGIIFNFFTIGRIVFKNKESSLIFRFVFVYGLTYGVHVAMLRVLIDKMGINKLVAEAIVTLPVALLSYLLNSIITYRTIRLPFRRNQKPGETN